MDNLLHDQIKDQEIAQFVLNIKPRHRLFGIDERDLWKIISEIEKYYDQREAERESRVLLMSDMLDMTRKEVNELHLIAEDMRR